MIAARHTAEELNQKIGNLKRQIAACNFKLENNRMYREERAALQAEIASAEHRLYFFEKDLASLTK